MDTSPPRSAGRKTLIGVLGLLLAGAGLVTGPPPPAGQERAHAADIPSDKPNLLFILTDDQRAGTMSVMPRVEEAFDVVFTNAVVTTPVCCPSRASILTGRYAHNTGVRTNGGYPRFRKRWEDRSLGPWLQAQGYRTGLIGKYMNRFGEDDPVPPGWDELYVRVSGDHTTFRLREAVAEGPGARNEVVAYPNAEAPSPYLTEVIGSLATGFLDRSADPLHNPSGKPWALFVWPTAPHEPLTVSQEHADSSIPAWRPSPAFMERAMGDKPPEVRKSRKARRSAAAHRRIRARQLRMLMSVDAMVGDLLDRVQVLGIADRTWGLYTSDNGYLWGEHRLTEKHFGYEESIRVPFRVMDPASGPSRVGSLVANIDIAPTLVELAGGRVPSGVDGRSLVPILSGERDAVRSRVVIEAGNLANGYIGLRTERWSYIRWRRSGRRELYDLRRDPSQLRNVARRRPSVVRTLQRRLRTVLNA